uniref:Uncharacterized protein n=1 Tax=Oryza barthii TaxID=65489 RepID=A0A0D3GWW5_9ORYZ
GGAGSQGHRAALGHGLGCGQGVLGPGTAVGRRWCGQGVREAAAALARGGGGVGKGRRRQRRRQATTEQVRASGDIGAGRRQAATTEQSVNPD